MDISDYNKKYACDSYYHMVHQLKKYLESLTLVSGMSKVWEDNDGRAKKYRCDLAIYLMTVLPSSYSIIMDRAINASGHGKNGVGGLDATDKSYLKRK